MSRISREEERELRISRNVHAVPSRKTRLSRNLPIFGYVAVVSLLIVSLVGAAKVLGWYGTTGKVSADGKAVTLTSTSAGVDLKGWMSLDSFLKAFSLTKKEFTTQFRLKVDLPSDTTLGAIGEITDEKVSMEALRTWVDTGHKLDVSSVTTTSANSATTSTTKSPTPATSKPATSSSSESKEDFLIKGRTTIQEVLDQSKVTKATFYAKFGLPSSMSTSTTLSGIKATLPDFEVSLVQSWFDAL